MEYITNLITTQSLITKHPTDYIELFSKRKLNTLKAEYNKCMAKSNAIASTSHRVPVIVEFAPQIKKMYGLELKRHKYCIDVSMTVQQFSYYLTYKELIFPPNSGLDKSQISIYLFFDNNLRNGTIGEIRADIMREREKDGKEDLYFLYCYISLENTFG